MLIIKNTLLQGTGITNIYIKDNLIADISPIFVKNKNDKVFDAKGKVVLPGLIDSHLHSCLSVTLSSAISCDLKNAKNVNDLKKTIKNHIIKHKIKEGE
jgi:predicted amidohydrolase YtcJ